MRTMNFLLAPFKWIQDQIFNTAYFFGIGAKCDSHETYQNRAVLSIVLVMLAVFLHFCNITMQNHDSAKGVTVAAIESPATLANTGSIDDTKLAKIKKVMIALRDINKNENESESQNENDLKQNVVEKPTYTVPTIEYSQDGDLNTNIEMF